MILFDREGLLRRALDAEMPSTSEWELRVQLEHLRTFDHVERFGGRFLFPLAHLYRIGRTVVFALLAEQGIFEFNQVRGFEYCRSHFPCATKDIDEVARLRPFARLVNGSRDHPLPFSFEDCGDSVESAREAIRRLVSLSTYAATISY